MTKFDFYACVACIMACLAWWLHILDKRIEKSKRDAEFEELLEREIQEYRESKRIAQRGYDRETPQ